jgi:hypothetical protein
VRVAIDALLFFFFAVVFMAVLFFVAVLFGDKDGVEDSVGDGVGDWKTAAGASAETSPHKMAKPKTRAFRVRTH